MRVVSQCQFLCAEYLIQFSLVCVLSHNDPKWDFFSISLSPYLFIHIIILSLQSLFISNHRLYHRLKVSVWNQIFYAKGSATNLFPHELLTFIVFILSEKKTNKKTHSRLINLSCLSYTIFRWWQAKYISLYLHKKNQNKFNQHEIISSKRIIHRIL